MNQVLKERENSREDFYPQEVVYKEEDKKDIDMSFIRQNHIKTLMSYLFLYFVFTHLHTNFYTPITNLPKSFHTLIIIVVIYLMQRFKLRTSIIKEK